jgi:hypothetical protein
VKIRLTGSPAEVQLAIHRLKQCFSEVTAGEPRPCRRDGQLIRLVVTARF